MHARLILALAVAAAPAVSAQGEPAAAGARLSLAEAVARALARHPSLGAPRAASDEARAAASGIAAARLPTVALTASAVRYGEPMLVAPLHGLEPGVAPAFDETLVQGAAVASWTLFDGGARGARIEQAREQAAAAGAAVEAAAQALAARVATTYLSVLSRARLLGAHDARLAALEGELARARQRHEVGRAPRLEVLRAEAALASARAERVRAAEGLDLAERELARLTGGARAETRAPRLEPVAPCDSLPPARDELLRLAMGASPAIAAARRRLAAAEAQEGVARGARWPEVRLSAAYHQRGGAASAYEDDWSAGASLSLPLFTGGATASGVARARAARREAGERLRLATLDVEAEIDRALSAAAEARARAASLTSAAARFAEVARIQQLALDAGTGTQTDYLAAVADLLAARAGLAEAELMEAAARTELARASGQLTTTWLARAMESGR